MKEIYLPIKAEVVEVLDMTPDTKLFKVKPERPVHYQPGQFFMLSLWGKGEVPISITSACGFHEYVELCIRRVGYITSAIHEVKPPCDIGLRGPFGNTFLAENAKNKDIIFVAGGLGIAPLRPLITRVMNEKKRSRRIALLYGSRNPGEILFKDDIEAWQEKGLQLFLGVRKGLQFILSAGKKDNCLLSGSGPAAESSRIPKISFKNAYAFVCGPPVMISPTMITLSTMGMDENNIYTSLEAHMKCGVGKCGHCYVDGVHLCTDGPIFSYAEIRKRRLQIV
ncbi:MAG: FAD/NAD(P)-binding protein [Thermodesulfovibrionales bacterium]|nr:FAD/NAD(P)-binding protein [Thermodesulfovibrionales bacterium]